MYQPMPRGCGRYLEAPGCPGTLATKFNNLGGLG
jgi:hypothetical protein